MRKKYNNIKAACGLLFILSLVLILLLCTGEKFNPDLQGKQRVCVTDGIKVYLEWESEEYVAILEQGQVVTLTGITKNTRLGSDHDKMWYQVIVQLPEGRGVIIGWLDGSLTIPLKSASFTAGTFCMEKSNTKKCLY